jgi:hypothetical protein
VKAKGGGGRLLRTNGGDVDHDDTTLKVTIEASLEHSASESATIGDGAANDNKM